MKIYNALIKKNKEGKIEDVVLIKEGFSFFAFLFSSLWFLYHKMWREFLALALINFAIVSTGNGLFGELDKFFLEFALILIVGLNANYWFCDHLKRKDYEFIGLVFGENQENAKLRFIKNFEADQSFDANEFDDSILNPKLHRQMMKLKKSHKIIA